MRILVIGGYGLIGAYVMARLHAEGHDLVGLGRDAKSAARRLSYARWVRGDLAKMGAAGDWAKVLVGIDAVVNCAGALQDSPRDDLRAVHVQAIDALIQACAAKGLRRLVHISAAGVEAGRVTAFNDTKLQTESLLARSDLDWVVLRPGLVLAPSAYGGTALLRGLAAFPLMIPAAHPDAVIQVVSAEDVAEAVARAVKPNAPSRIAVDLVSAEPTRLGEILVALRAWLGIAPAPLVRAPTAIGAGLADLIALFGWRSPMRSTALAQLSQGVTGSPALAQDQLDLKVRPLAAILAAWPSGVQERWFARLYFLKPVALVGLIAYWLASGVIGLTGGYPQAVTTLTLVGVAATVAKVLVIGGGLTDIALAVTACFRRATPWALRGMLAVCATYLIAGSALRPDLWLDPLGPLVKIPPVMLLAMMSLAIMDER